MTPQTTPVRKQADAPLHLQHDLPTDPQRGDAKEDASWIRPAPGEDKYADVPCTD